MDDLCDGCKHQDYSGMRQCPKCDKKLCWKCSGGKSQCKDSPKGTAGCSGYFQPVK